MKCACHGSSVGHRKSSGEKSLPAPQRVSRPDRSTAAPVPDVVQKTLAMPGQPLEWGTRRLMETLYGHDFSKVRVHDDQVARGSANALDALAYTVGTHIVLDRQRVPRDSYAAKRVFAHELVHVVQQSNSAPETPLILAESLHSEAEAELASRRAMRGRGTPGGQPAVAYRPSTGSPAPDLAPPAEDLQYLAWGWGEAARDAFVGVAPLDVDTDSVGFLACTPLLDLPPRAAAAYLGTYLLALLRSIEGQEKSGFFHDVGTRAHVLNALTQPMLWRRVVPLVFPQGRACLKELVMFLASRRGMLNLDAEQADTMESLATASV